MLGRVLRTADYDVASFACGDAFLASLSEQVPACVILDVHMPGLSGFEIESRLRATHRDLPVVFITASDDPSLDHAACEARGATLLRKPFTSKQLLGAIDTVLRARPPAA